MVDIALGGEQGREGKGEDQGMDGLGAGGHLFLVVGIYFPISG